MGGAHIAAPVVGLFRGKLKMELSEFITSSLTQLTTGIADAREAVEGAGGSINPGAASEAGMVRGIQVGEFTVPVVDIEFDVAVTASESDGSSGGIAVVAGFLSVGGSSKRQTGDEQVSRLRFTIPMALPVGAAEQKRWQGGMTRHVPI